MWQRGPDQLRDAPFRRRRHRQAGQRQRLYEALEAGGDELLDASITRRLIEQFMSRPSPGQGVAVVPAYESGLVNPGG